MSLISRRNKQISGWWLTYPSEKDESMGRLIPYIMENNEMWVKNGRPLMGPQMLYSLV